MKVLGLSCSPRKGGNTEILVKRALDGARKECASADFLSLADRDIHGCDGCTACAVTGVCKIEDDAAEILDKMLEADGIVFGTPIYMYGMASQAKAIIDRSYALRHPHLRLANKVGAVIAVATKLGQSEAIKDFYLLFALNHMLSADFVAGMANWRGEIAEDSNTMNVAFEQGRQVAQLVARRFSYPEEFARTRLADYVEAKYGGRGS